MMKWELEDDRSQYFFYKSTSNLELYSKYPFNDGTPLIHALET